MADNRTMTELLQAPTEGYEDAIVIPKINANFELKNGLINLVQNKQFFRHDKEDPHAHIRYFNKITSTMRFLDIPSTLIKLMLFPFSLEGSARIWLEKEPPRSILTWDDLVSKFINQFFPPSKTTNLRNEITRFQQRFDESFYKAWDRFNDLLRACLIGMDKSKITRKQSKVSKHGHENQKSAKPKPQKTKALANFHLQGPILLSSKVLYNLKRRNEREGPNVLNSQTPTVLTVEKEAGTIFTIHRLSHFHLHGKTKGK
ncbi:reverse transcriptase domain-containing protein [Tanacetum coccineum]